MDIHCKWKRKQNEKDKGEWRLEGDVVCDGMIKRQMPVAKMKESRMYATKARKLIYVTEIIAFLPELSQEKKHNMKMEVQKLWE